MMYVYVIYLMFYLDSDELLQMMGATCVLRAP